MFPPIYDAADMFLMACIITPIVFCAGVCWERERVAKRRRRHYVNRSIR